MKRLKFPIVKNKFEYNLVRRVNQMAVVRKSNLLYPDAPLSYEFWHIRENESWIAPGGVKVDSCETPPTGNMWGKYGLSFYNVSDALEELDKQLITSVSVSAK